MSTLSEIQKQADILSPEDRAGLVSCLLDSLPDPPPGPDEAEVARRVEEMDSGAVKSISYDQFLAEVGRE
jgi:putative addiction module component (TIGR02574 family)